MGHPCHCLQLRLKLLGTKRKHQTYDSVLLSCTGNDTASMIFKGDMSYDYRWNGFMDIFGQTNV